MAITLDRFEQGCPSLSYNLTPPYGMKMKLVALRGYYQPLSKLEPELRNV
jgi:hypothetical protein